MREVLDRVRGVQRVDRGALSLNTMLRPVRLREPSVANGAGMGASATDLALAAALRLRAARCRRPRSWYRTGATGHRKAVRPVIKGIETLMSLLL